MPEPASATTIAQALNQTATQNGAMLAALSKQRPLLLVFLRQFG
jgi:hypothetical protein